jgi:hypothetical protein
MPQHPLIHDKSLPIFAREDPAHRVGLLSPAFALLARLRVPRRGPETCELVQQGSQRARRNGRIRRLPHSRDEVLIDSVGQDEGCELHQVSIAALNRERRSLTPRSSANELERWARLIRFSSSSIKSTSTRTFDSAFSLSIGTLVPAKKSCFDRSKADVSHYEDA